MLDTSSPVLVNGATDYAAGWLVKELLEAGVTPHAAVRDPSKMEKHAQIKPPKMPQAPSSIFKKEKNHAKSK